VSGFFFFKYIQHMRFLTPNNIFAVLLQKLIKESSPYQMQFKDASVLSTELENGNADLALIPSCDLVKHPDFFISSRVALSFDGSLSNAFFYFIPGQNKFNDLYLKGDITTNEIIFSKILFKERYSSDVQIHLETAETEFGKKNYLIAGDSNFQNGNFNRGLSFSDELSTLLFLPYVNFVIASKQQAIIEQFNEINTELEHNADTNSNLFSDMKFNENTMLYLKENMNSVYFEATETEMEGLKELLLLPYYHGITDEPVELRIV